MPLKKIKEKAEALGLNSENKNKKDLIHAIQVAEGNFPCFQTATDFCDQAGCCWRDDCLSPCLEGACLEGEYLEEVKTKLERLMGTIENLKTTTNKLVKKKKRHGSKKAWKSTRKGIENSWKEITRALKELTTKF